LSKAFKARNAGARETYRIQRKKGRGADVFTLSDLPKTERVTHTYTPRKAYETELRYANLKVTYCRNCRSTVQATAASAAASDQTSPENKKARVFNTALTLTGLKYGVAKAESQRQFDSTVETCALMTNACACYKNSKKLPPMRLENLFDLGNKVKS
jgi:hypothetical protein